MRVRTLLTTQKKKRKQGKEEKESVLTWLRENACQNSAEPERRAGSRSDEKGDDMCVTDLVKPGKGRGFTKQLSKRHLSRKQLSKQHPSRKQLSKNQRKVKQTMQARCKLSTTGKNRSENSRNQKIKIHQEFQVLFSARLVRCKQLLGLVSFCMDRSWIILG
jgi:hypothetical protein